MGLEELPSFFVFVFFVLFLRFSLCYFPVVLRFSLVLLRQEQPTAIHWKMGNFTPTLSAPTPFRTPRPFLHGFATRSTDRKIKVAFFQSGGGGICTCVKRNHLSFWVFSPNL